MINIICILWNGVFRGRNFSALDVVNLYEDVKRNIDRPFKFYCLTNHTHVFYHLHNLDIILLPLKHNWPGWWAKVELHRPDLPEGRTLYLDLDTHIVGNLQPILDYEGDLVMFNTVAGAGGGGVVRRYQAATMLFDSGNTTMFDVYERFRLGGPEHWMEKYRSDQDVMGDWIPNQPTFPNEWMLKLNNCKNMAELPKEVIIVTGQPKDISFRDIDKIKWYNNQKPIVA